MKKVNVIGLFVILCLLVAMGVACLISPESSVTLSTAVIACTSFGLALTIVNAYFRLGLPDPHELLPPKE